MNNRGRIVFWLVSIFFLPSGSAKAQLIGKMDDAVILSDFPYNITAYGADQKVPQSQVLSMIKDPKTGIILFSTMDGVAEFNGYEITPIWKPDGKEFDVYKKLFFGKNGEALYGWSTSDILFNITDSLRWLGGYKAVQIDSEFFVTVDADGILYFRDERKGISLTFPTKIRSATYLKVLSDQNIILSDNRKSYLLNLVTQEVKVYLNEPLIKVLEENSIRYLVGSNSFYIEKESRIKKSTLLQGVSPNINDFQKVGDYLVFSSYNGLYAIGEGILYHFDDTSVLPTRLLSALLYDKEENQMYAGTGDKGFLKFSPKYFVNYFKKGKNSRGSASSLVNVGDSLIISSGYQRLLTVDLEGNVRKMTGNSVFASLSIFGDSLFAGSWNNGLWVYSLKKQQLIDYVKLDNENVHAPFKDRKGVYWIGCSHGLYTGPSIQQLVKFEAARFNRIITTIYEDRAGNLWIGGVDGVVVLGVDRSVKLVLNRAKGLRAKEVRSFYEDDHNRMWIGSYGGGLYCFADNHLVELGAFPNYMLGNDIFCLARDTFGNILMTSNNGLRVIQEEALVRFLERKSDFLIPYHLSTPAGIYNPEFNGGFINNYAAIQDKFFFFPTIQGVVRYDAVQFKPASNYLGIKQIFLDDKAANFPSVIPRLTKYIRIELHNVHFSPHTNVYYQYRLGNRSDQGVWSPPQKSTTLTFSQLKPGKYRLEVRAIDASNNPNPPVVTYDFYIAPHFYEKNEFYAGLFFFFSLLVGLFLWYSFHRQQRKEKQKMDVKNTIIELQLRAIQAQMNPHFIFNVLNRLVELISSAKLIQAERFVIDFAKLLRNILEQSERDFITIREELKTLQIYMEIQKTRRLESFQYQIVAEEALYGRQIPTMLIQPFLENAIVHGVDHAEYPTKINLSLKLEDGDLHIRVQDNGIGREQAQKISQNRKSESRGIELIQRKIDLLQKKYQIEIILMIHDWKDKPPFGTEVHLIIKHF